MHLLNSVRKKSIFALQNSLLQKGPFFMDQTDIKIMNILQEDCKTTTREIGKLVGLTAPAVSERVTRLREAGAITGFHAKLDPVCGGCRRTGTAACKNPNLWAFTNFCGA